MNFKQIFYVRMNSYSESIMNLNCGSYFTYTDLYLYFDEIGFYPLVYNVRTNIMMIHINESEEINSSITNANMPM